MNYITGLKSRYFEPEKLASKRKLDVLVSAASLPFVALIDLILVGEAKVRRLTPLALRLKMKRWASLFTLDTLTAKLNAVPWQVELAILLTLVLVGLTAISL